MSRRNLAAGTFVIAAIVALTAFLISTPVLQAVNPVAALTAITVAVIGIAWFKKTSR